MPDEDDDDLQERLLRTAGPHEVDPTHLIALASSLRELKRDFAKLSRVVDKFVTEHKVQLSEDELKVIRLILLGRDRSIWLKGQARYWLGGIGLVFTTVYLLRDWIKGVGVWIGNISR